MGSDGEDMEQRIAAQNGEDAIHGVRDQQGTVWARSIRPHAVTLQEVADHMCQEAS